MPCLSNCSLKLPLDMAKHGCVLLSARKMLLRLLQWMFWLGGNHKSRHPELWSSWPGKAIAGPLHRARWHLGNQIRGSGYAICTAAPKTDFSCFVGCRDECWELQFHAAPTVVLCVFTFKQSLQLYSDLDCRDATEKKESFAAIISRWNLGTEMPLVHHYNTSQTQR